MKKLILTLVPTAFFLVLLSLTGSVHAQSGCGNNTSPPLSGGGSVFGSIVSQWIQYFAQKIDVNNGVACNITLNGTISGTAFPINPASLGTASTKNVGKSVNDPGTGSLENLLPVQTAAGAGPITNISNGTYLQQMVVRSNSASSMTDTLPASTIAGMANGAQIDIANTDASASDTISAGAGTTITSGSSYVLAAGRDIRLVYDLANTDWKFDANTSTAGLVNSANSWSALQTFGAADLAILGSSTGHTLLESANAGASNYIVTIPGATDTIALLAASQTLTNKSIAGSEINSGLVGGTYGGTGVNNGASTLTLGASFTLNGGGTLSVASGKTATVSNSITFTGTDSTSFVFPTTSKTIAANDLSNVTLSGGCTNSGTTLTCGSSILPQGRLTLTSGTPVMISDVVNSQTIYYDSYNGGNKVAVYNGSGDVFLSIGAGEIGDTMPTSSTGVTNSAGVFDEWAVNVSGTLTLCHATNGSGGGWASDTGGSNTARGSGYSQIDYTTRTYLTNKNAITHCYNGATDEGSVTANEATYLGSVYTTASGKTTMQFSPAAGTGGSNTFLGLWNAYNRVHVSSLSQDSTSSWTYGTAAWHAADASSSNRISWIDGLAESAVNGQYTVGINPNAASSGAIGADFDSTSAAPQSTAVIGGNISTESWNITVAARLNAAVGLHYEQAMEYGNATPLTYYGSGTIGQTQTLSLSLDM